VTAIVRRDDYLSGHGTDPGGARSVTLVTAVLADATDFGSLLRAWRAHRRLSQLQLASEAAVSTRHLSFLETGRAKPSREMVLHLAEELEVPLRERNSWLVAAGFAPAYHETGLDDPHLAAARQAVDLVLAAQEPLPALVVDRAWNLVAANAGLALFLPGVADHLLADRPNVVRASLHPEGLAPRIANLEEYSAHLLGRIRRQVALTGDVELTALLAEVRTYPGVVESAHVEPRGAALLPLRLRPPAGEDGPELALFSTIATFGSPTDVTLDELAIESFFPADDATAAALRT
jgi:transcriptional regulator with XRE-family HTH domain